MDSHTNADARGTARYSNATSGISLVAKLLCVLVVLAVVVTGPAGGLSRGMAQQPAGAVEVTGTSVADGKVTAAVAVLDAASNPVPGLTGEDFTVQIDGAAVAGATITTGVDTALPLGIVLTVDTSGSMAGAAINAAKEAILPLVSALQASDQAALVTFANDVVEAVPITSDTAALSAAIEAMEAAGNTALFAGVVRASEVAAAAPQPRRAVVLLSDGEDFGSVSGGITGPDALAAAGATGVPFFVVGLGQEVDQPFLTSLAADTGGQYFAAADPAELAQLYGRISDRLRQQYTISVALPDGLDGGTHRLTVSAAGASGFATFETESAPTVPALTIGDLPDEIAERTTIAVAGAPAGSEVRIELNGEPLPTTGNSADLDPYLLEPGSYTLVVRTEPETALPIERTIAIPALPPEIVAPTEIPDLRPGDLVRLTVRAQPGETAVGARVDGTEVYLASEPPFEFVLPDDDYSSGSHDLSVSVETAGGTAERTFTFEGPAEPGTNYALFVLLALAALAVVAGLVLGGRKALAWQRNRPEPINVEGVGEQLAAWSELRRGRGDIGETETAVLAPVQPGAWGTLTVTAGPDAGQRFDLRDDTELVGRGRFCSVRLTDPKVEEAHFVISRNGRLSASTPAARLRVDGAEARTVLLEARAVVQLGATEAEISLVNEIRPSE